MKKFLMLAAMALSVAGFAVKPAQAAAQIGEAAPAFKAMDIEGHEVSLDALKGKIVVLEWTNAECPFVKKHYGSHNMQETQKKAAEMGDVVWISVNSGAPGKQGHVDAAGAKEVIAAQGAHPTHYIIDEAGMIGHKYDAKTTPHMFVIDAEGHLAYQGAIDDDSSANPAAVEGATNYVLAALESLKHGHDVAVAETQPYGCGVKY